MGEYIKQKEKLVFQPVTIPLQSVSVCPEMRIFAGD